MYIQRCAVKFSRWGNSIAVRIPAEVVAKLGITPDDEAQIKVTGEYSFEITRDRRRLEAIEAIRKLSRPLPLGYKFNRDEIYDRAMMKRQDRDQDQNREQVAS